MNLNERRERESSLLRSACSKTTNDVSIDRRVEPIPVILAGPPGVDAKAILVDAFPDGVVFDLVTFLRAGVSVRETGADVLRRIRTFNEDNPTIETILCLDLVEDAEPEIVAVLHTLILHRAALGCDLPENVGIVIIAETDADDNPILPEEISSIKRNKPIAVVAEAPNHREWIAKGIRDGMATEILVAIMDEPHLIEEKYRDESSQATSELAQLAREHGPHRIPRPPSAREWTRLSRLLDGENEPGRRNDLLQSIGPSIVGPRNVAVVAAILSELQDHDENSDPIAKAELSLRRNQRSSIADILLILATKDDARREEAFRVMRTLESERRIRALEIIALALPENAKTDLTALIREIMPDFIQYAFRLSS
jgi:hypothetical protein